MKSPNISAWRVQKNENLPAWVAVNVWLVVQGPRHVGWPSPGSEKLRLWSTPTSLLTNVAVSEVPALTRMTARSNARFSAVTVTEVTAGGGGALVGAGGAVATGWGVGGAAVAAVVAIGEGGAVAVAGLAAAVVPAVDVAFGAGDTASGTLVALPPSGEVAKAVAGVVLLSPPPQAAKASAPATKIPKTSHFMLTFVLFFARPCSVPYVRTGSFGLEHRWAGFV